MPYSTDLDLVKIRPKIMTYDVAKWDDQRAEAESQINIAIDRKWYRQESDHLGVDWRKYPFNAALMLNAATQLKTLSCYKTLELAYLFLMKDAPEPDAFERQHKMFKKMANDELASVLSTGVDYDWDESGSITYLETKRPSRRRLRRC